MNRWSNVFHHGLSKSMMKGRKSMMKHSRSTHVWGISLNKLNRKLHGYLSQNVMYLKQISRNSNLNRMKWNVSIYICLEVNFIQIEKSKHLSVSSVSIIVFLHLGVAAYNTKNSTPFGMFLCRFYFHFFGCNIFISFFFFLRFLNLSSQFLYFQQSNPGEQERDIM